MKKYLNLLFAALALLGIVAACQKDNLRNGSNQNAGKTVSIRVTAPEGLTKMTLTDDGNDSGPVKLAWEESDVITIGGNVFTIESGSISNDGHAATFTGTAPSASTFDIVYNGGASYDNQSQVGNGGTSHLRYGATLHNVNSYEGLSFSESYATAHGGTFEQSGILRVRAKLPAEVSGSIYAVHFKASEGVFSGSMKVIFDSPLDASSDPYVTIYANLPGSATIPAGGYLLAQFQTSTADNNLYTAAVQFSSQQVLSAGKVNDFALDRSGANGKPSILNVANASLTNIGTAENPYLIGDKHQLSYMYDAMTTDNVTYYFKLVDDVDWTGGVSGKTNWKNLNNTGSYVRGVNLDGNNKTIYGLNDNMFYVLLGEVRNLTLDHTSFTIGAYSAGALAAFIIAPTVVIDNVDVKNSTVANNGTRTAGAIVGRIGVSDTANASSPDLFATITNCDITNTNVTGGTVGGLIGWANARVIVSGCTFDGGTITSGDKPYAGGIVARSENYVSTFTDCHVTNATINMAGLTTAQTHYGRGGGFSGMLSTQNTVKGCTVGTSSQHVKVIFPAAEDVDKKNNLNCGGFSGINYGLITKDDSDNHCTAYVDIVIPNEADTELHLGGFVGYNTGVIEYADVDASFSTSATESIALTHGQHIGGFVGFNWNENANQLGKVENCTGAGSVSGQDRVGGFIGYMKSGTVKDCSTSATVNANQYVGGFFGEVMDATEISGDSSTGVVTGATAYIGGFAGRFAGSVSCSNCKHETGKVSCPKGGNAATYVGGFVGYIGDLSEAFTGTITGCYVNNAVVESVYYEGTSAKSSGTWNGGFAGVIGSQTYANNTGLVEKCGVHASGKNGGQYLGGFAGVSYSKIEKCKVTGQFTMTAYGNSAGGFVGYQKGGHVKYCYSNATIRHNNKSNIGGLIGYANSTTVEECYSVGNITKTGSASTNNSTWGGVIGKADTPYTVTRLIRWNSTTSDKNNTIIGNVSDTPTGCYVKTSSDSNFYNKASSLGWNTDGSIWVYPDGGGVPSLKGV